MTYIWQDFNIKTFPAETIVFRNGEFCPEFSTLETTVVDKNYNLPVHYIYVGELTGDNVLNIEIKDNVKNQPVFISVRVNVKNNADLKIVIKNSSMDSVIRGFIVLENHGNLKFDIDAYHLARNTGILLKTRLVAYKNSVSNLSGVAHIYQYCDGCDSDLDFSAMADTDAKVIFKPVQRISAVPESASHSANIFNANPAQIEYLHESGLTDDAVQNVMREAFVNNTDF